MAAAKSPEATRIRDSSRLRLTRLSRPVAVGLSDQGGGGRQVGALDGVLEVAKDPRQRTRHRSRRLRLALAHGQHPIERPQPGVGQFRRDQDRLYGRARRERVHFVGERCAGRQVGRRRAAARVARAEERADLAPGVTRGARIAGEDQNEYAIDLASNGEAERSLGQSVALRSRGGAVGDPIGQRVGDLPQAVQQRAAHRWPAVG